MILIIQIMIQLYIYIHTYTCVCTVVVLLICVIIGRTMFTTNSSTRFIVSTIIITNIAIIDMLIRSIINISYV